VEVGKWLQKKVKGTFRLMSVSAVNTVLAQADTSLTDAKVKAQGMADQFKLSASKKQEEADRLSTEASIANKNSRTIQTALDEIDNAEGM